LRFGTLFLPSKEVARQILRGIAKISKENENNKEPWYAEGLAKFNLPSPW
jgi:hypothetical protein